MTEISKLKRQPLLKDLAYEWLESLKRTRRKSTIVKYSNQLSKHIIPRFGNKRINKISNKDINSFANELLEKKKSISENNFRHYFLYEIHSQICP